MAQIKPFRAWRYNDELVKNIGELTSPLFDVASEKEKAALYGNPQNSIHLSIPCGECPSENASKILRQWKDERLSPEGHRCRDLSLLPVLQASRRSIPLLPQGIHLQDPDL